MGNCTRATEIQMIFFTKFIQAAVFKDAVLFKEAMSFMNMCAAMIVGTSAAHPKDYRTKSTSTKKERTIPVRK